MTLKRKEKVSKVKKKTIKRQNTEQQTTPLTKGSTKSQTNLKFQVDAMFYNEVLGCQVDRNHRR